MAAYKDGPAALLEFWSEEEKTWSCHARAADYLRDAAWSGKRKSGADTVMQQKVGDLWASLATVPFCRHSTPIEQCSLSFLFESVFF